MIWPRGSAGAVAARGRENGGAVRGSKGSEFLQESLADPSRPFNLRVNGTKSEAAVSAEIYGTKCGVLISTSDQLFT